VRPGHRRQEVNQAFFDSWTPEMAWVLGVIATDGCLRAPHVDPRTGLRTGGLVAITQKEPEILEKVLSSMGATARIHFRPARQFGSVLAGAVHYVHIHDKSVFDALVRLGLTPRKSRTLVFPEAPAPVLRHFIRGCWDGDGSISVNTRANGLVCSFVSASKAFMMSLVEHLRANGIDVYRVYAGRQPRGGAIYQIKLTGQRALRLCHWMYANVPDGLALSRKRDAFERVAVKAPAWAEPNALRERTISPSSRKSGGVCEARSARVGGPPATEGLGHDPVPPGQSLPQTQPADDTAGPAGRTSLRPGKPTQGPS